MVTNHNNVLQPDTFRSHECQYQTTEHKQQKTCAYCSADFLAAVILTLPMSSSLLLLRYKYECNIDQELQRIQRTNDVTRARLATVSRRTLHMQRADVMAAILKVWRQIKNPTRSIDAYLAYLTNNLAKFHPDPIRFEMMERGLVPFLNRVVPITTTTTRRRWWIAIWDQFSSWSNKSAIITTVTAWVKRVNRLHITKHNYRTILLGHLSFDLYNHKPMTSMTRNRHIPSHISFSFFEGPGGQIWVIWTKHTMLNNYYLL